MNAHSARTISRESGRRLATALAERLRVADRPPQRYDAGAPLLRAGEVVHRLPLLVSGRADAVLHLQGADGGSVIPVSWHAGELIGVSHLFHRGPSMIEVRCSEPVALHWLSLETLEQTIQADGALLVPLVQFLTQRLREVQWRERAWVERGTHERVLVTLSRLAATAGPAPEVQGAGGEGGRFVAITHEQLAERCGMSRPKVSVELKRLEQAGHVRLERGAIRIVSLPLGFDGTAA